MSTKALEEGRPAPECHQWSADPYFRYLAELANRANRPSRVLSSGINSLDQTFPGWLREGRLIVIAGRPGVGKSAFASQLAEAIAGGQRSALIFSLEMTSDEIFERAVMRHVHPTLKKLSTDEPLDSEEFTRAARAASDYGRLPIGVVDQCKTLNDIVRTAREKDREIQQASFPRMGCVVVDYIQRVRVQAENRTFGMGDITESLKALARELSVPVIALSQLNRYIESRPDRQPQLSDLRDSGEIEQDADAVLFLTHSAPPAKHHPTHIPVRITMAKNRFGPVGEVTMNLISERVMFQPISADARVPAAINHTGARKLGTIRYD